MIAALNQQHFLESCTRARSERQLHGIGTLREKGVHAALKYYYEPFPSNHEIKVGRFVADIVGENGIIEIQTRRFFRLREKLRDFLSACPVTVVYPVVTDRWLIRMEEETGSMISRRKSSKRGRPLDIFFELYSIREFLTNPDLHFLLPCIQIEEYRLGKSRQKGTFYPIALTQELAVERPKDWLALLPEGLPDPFTTQDLARLGKISRETAGRAALLLHELGLLTRTRKSGHGNGYYYQLAMKFVESPVVFSAND
jgi:hypothetical protein